MFLPQSYETALLLMIGSMLCWGSWANSVKLCPGYRFQLFYWDYVIGLLVGAFGLGITMGSMGSTGRPFLADLGATEYHHILWAIAGGAVFNIANLLLVAAIDIAGMAVAFPIGIGLALIVGAVSSYLLSPHGNPLMLFGGIALVVGAIVCDSLAYRLREATHPQTSRRGVIISLICGLLMGSFYPLVSKSMVGEGAPGPYAVSFLFVVGVALCAIPVNLLLMAKPLDLGEPVAMRGYFEAPGRWHFWGALGGIIWCIGGTLNFVASRGGGRARGLVLHRPGRDHGLGALGRVCM